MLSTISTVATRMSAPLSQASEVTAQFRDNPEDSRFPSNLIVMTFADEVIDREKA